VGRLLDLASVRHNVIVYRPDARAGSGSSGENGGFCYSDGGFSNPGGGSSSGIRPYQGIAGSRLDDALADGIIQGIGQDPTRSEYLRALSAIELCVPGVHDRTYLCLLSPWSIFAVAPGCRPRVPPLRLSPLWVASLWC